MKGSRFALLLVGLGACEPDTSAPRPPARDDGAGAWTANPAAEVRAVRGGDFRIRTGPHTLVVPADAPAVAPPYGIRATMQKHRGRLVEGFGLVFGGENLLAPQSRQAYSYFLVRGDGSFLIKQRQGAATRVVRPWTNHPAIPRDTEDGGQPVELAVQVGVNQVRFRVGEREVAAVPAAELRTRGHVGVRVAHGVELSVNDFRVRQGD